MTLAELGWTDSLATAFAAHAVAGLEPARVVCELRRNFYAVHTAAGEVLGECGGGFFHLARTPDQFPAVGDWVAVKRREGELRADIHAVLPRRTKFSRRASGSEEIEQIVAANIDTVFLVSGLDRNFNPKRIQRFLVAAHESGAAPVIILNKSDVCDDADVVKREVEVLAPGVPVLITSTTTRKGLKALALRCRFTNCGHTNEPGCTVRAALAGGELLAARFDAYRKLKAEKTASAPKERKPSALASRPSWKQKAEGQKPFRHRQHQDD